MSVHAAAAYPTEQQAFARVEAVKRAGHWWPGVRHRRYGQYELTFDPQYETPQTGETT